MIPAIAVSAFFLLLNTAPLNAAVINSVGAHIRATALAVNIFIIHILGDVPSPTMMGWMADRRSLQAAFILPVIAMGISSAILFYGMRFAPPMRSRRRARRSREDLAGCFIFIGLRERFWRWLGSPALWMLRLACPAWRMSRLPKWDRNPVSPTGNPRVSIIVPARNEEETIEQALTALLALDYDNYEVIAVNDRSTDSTGRDHGTSCGEPKSPPLRQAQGRLCRENRDKGGAPSSAVIHHTELPAGWLGKTHAMWTAANQATGRLAAVH